VAFTNANKDLFFTKNDPRDLRLGDFAKSFEVPIKEDSFVVLGYPDDEGIKNNSGRIGASQAPDVIRKYLYKMTPHFLKEDVQPVIYDHGNLKIEGSLFERHEFAATTVENLLEKSKVISFGGGHDYGYPDGKAFLHKYREHNPLVINFDAHLDVRPLAVGSTAKISSGTPFFRLLSEFSNIDLSIMAALPWVVPSLLLLFDYVHEIIDLLVMFVYFVVESSNLFAESLNQNLNLI